MRGRGPAPVRRRPAGHAADRPGRPPPQRSARGRPRSSPCTCSARWPTWRRCPRSPTGTASPSSRTPPRRTGPGSPGRRAGSWGAAAHVQLLPRQEPRRPRRRRRRGLRRRRADRPDPAAGRPRPVRDRPVRATTSSGRNSRLDTLQAAVLQVKLRGLDEANRAPRRGRASATGRRCRPGASRSPCTPHAEPVHHLAVVQVPDRAAVTRALDAAGIGWGIHYPVPCHRQPAFAAVRRRAAAGRRGRRGRASCRCRCSRP